MISTRNRRAFTLVELLVFIAIIAILASLLLPTLVRGKAKALTTVKKRKEKGKKGVKKGVSP